MASLKFIEPMYARSVEKLPEGRDWLYEIKLDGYRCLAGRDAKGVILWSRTANIFTTQFPRVTRGFENEILTKDDDQQGNGTADEQP